MILYNGAETDLETDNHFLPAIHLAGPDGDVGPHVPRRPPGRHRDDHQRRRDDDPGRRHGVVLLARRPRPVARHLQAGRHGTRCADPRGQHPARGARRPALPGHRRHVDVEPARGRRRRDDGRPAPDVDTGSDQVRPHDDRRHLDGQGGRGHQDRRVRRRLRSHRPASLARAAVHHRRDRGQLHGPQEHALQGQLPEPLRACARRSADRAAHAQERVEPHPVLRGDGEVRQGPPRVGVLPGLLAQARRLEDAEHHRRRP